MTELLSLSIDVGGVLKEKGLMLATAESCTGGGVAHAVTAVAGSSQWFERGFVTYTNIAKQEMLGVRAQTLARFGAVSEETVREMAQGALNRSCADIALSVSGIAGPGGGSEAKPVGTVWFGWMVRGGQPRACCRQLHGDRGQVREQAVAIALKGVAEMLCPG